MPRGKQIDPEILQAALMGLEHSRAEIETKIDELRKMVDGRLTRRPGRPKGRATAAVVKPKKRTMSAAGKKRIAEAARKRWAAYRKAQEASQEATTED